MFPLVIYRILCVACWLCAGLQLCCAIDKLKEEQTARINCTRTCAHLTKDLVRTQLSYESGYCTDAMFKAKVVRIFCVVCPCLFALLLNCFALNSGKEQKRQIRRRCMVNCLHSGVETFRRTFADKISTQQACYKECLRKLGKQDKFEIYGKSQILKRIKRETSQPDPCIKCTSVSEDIDYYLTIPRENINLTWNGTNGRFSANISWIPPPESVNWTGYQLFYTKGYQNDYCCFLNLTKTSTYAIADNSSYGFVASSKNLVAVKVVALPFVHAGKYVLRKPFYVPGPEKQPVPSVAPRDPATTVITSPLTDPATAVVTSTSTDPATTAIPSTSTDPATTAIPSTSTDDKTSIRDPIIAVAIVIPILALLALLAYWYFRHPRDRLSKTGLSDTEFQFDAFIIYSSADEEWVKKILLPILEEKNALKCCIHYRDFVPGKPFRENMADSVYMSRKTIAVISHHFFKSQYCHHEMDMALGRLVKTGDNSVIVIKLDDVDGKKLPKALKERSYIDYYKLNDKETWEKQLIHCLKFSVKHMITQNSFVKSEMGGVCV